jgi:hypothetical protein
MMLLPLENSALDRTVNVLDMFVISCSVGSGEAQRETGDGMQAVRRLYDAGDRD